MGQAPSLQRVKRLPEPSIVGVSLAANLEAGPDTLLDWRSIYAKLHGHACSALRLNVSQLATRLQRE
jgi:hypothetical protein